MKRTRSDRQEAGISPDRFRRLVAVAHGSDLSFLELVGLAELDPATEFRGARIRGADLRGQDLSGFDLTGAMLIDCHLADCDLTHAIGVTERTIVRSLDGAIPRLPAGIRDRFWPDSDPPSWARDWGRDDYGIWANFTVPAADGALVTQRMRWIPKGEFLIGSPEEEDRQYDDEGPQKLIRIAEGFWLFDTPCTQALWLAVMGGDNPSQFQSPGRPVESVDFGQAGDFIGRLNEMKPGLRLSLPSEAQWEYACRAGTTGATYNGQMEIVADYNAPVLDAIAWYGGNCGQDFELDNGYDITGWSGKQYDDARGGTHPVARKRPNRWGLHDMLGNVWEWCADEWHDSHRLTPDNGEPYNAARRDRAAWRVFRGGSWYDVARGVRAASRLWDVPGARGDSLGFRCARGHEMSEASDKLSGSGRGKRGSGATGGRGRARSAPERAAQKR